LGQRGRRLERVRPRRRPLDLGLPGRPLIVELELTEPSLFMAMAPGSAERFAGTIAAVLGKQ
jgi:hypothetical protein